LVEYGAKLTEKSLIDLTEEEKKSLKQIQNKFNPQNLHKDPQQYYTRNPEHIEREQMAYNYLHPFEPKNFLEKTIVAIDRTGDFIKTKILRIDALHNALDGIRLYLQTDPTELRSAGKRLRQLRNFAFNATIVVAKQPVNLVIKPIALAANIVKTGLISLGMLINEAKGEKSNICSYSQLKATGREALKNLGEAIIAYGATALVLSGFGAPIAVVLAGATMSVSLGAANFGAANIVVAGLNTAMTQAVAFSGIPAANAVLMAEGALEWGILRPISYYALSPSKLFYKQEDPAEKLTSPELNSLGKRAQELHKESANPNISIEIRRAADKEIKKLKEIQTINKLVAPVVKKIVARLKER
jgi:hypothetical protein